MSIAKLTTPCTVKSVTSHNLYGEPIYGVARKSICAVLKLIKSRKSTTVRTDSAGSRGHADEANVDAFILMSSKEKIDLNDYIEIAGVTIRVSAIRPRFAVFGEFDHIEVRGDIE